VLPVGLGLLPQAPGWIRRGWGWLAPPAALALLLPRGGLATALSVPWPC